MTQRFHSITPGVHLSEQVAEALSAEIRAGRPAAGEKLPTEAALVEQFAVSRTVVREAVSRLKSLGVVESRQGSGVFVRQAAFAPLNFDTRSAASRQAVIQMVEVRRALEAEVAALAAQRRNATDIERIRQAIVALDEAVKAGGDGADEDVNYHRAIADAAQNPFLISTLDYLRQFLRGVTRVTRANEARRADFARQVRDEHEAIAGAIEAGDATRARRVAARHMDNAIKRIEQADPGFWKEAGVQLASPLVSGAIRR
ncbi:FadR/GntR family transcriptional regulator [Polaromonas sp. CG_9.11]|uniref:FadR/GntR family transcriptional regulator n=1 Tax=Polaromonas sp. CG_9.11 TaxID=2787730 RepID=UPI0018CA2BB3|nr:FadR/GntR family transcriptional regulator [Polaromonas sp. CG_9.11]MBG6074403.1 GntR family transcriptional repressor for pyruvate dehydrogenase complex [Polaromonas sp. CG_9.11]